jgi:hypothetical protein
LKFRHVLVVACCLALTACGSLHMPKVKVWPFYKKPKPVPEAVHELNLVNSDGSGASYPQYWSRNTLVIDLSGVSGEGGVAARLPEETTWPVRVAVRVQPGRVGQLEMQAEERNVVAVSPEGAKPVDIELSSSLYTPTTAAIYISWRPAPVIVDTAPEAPAEPEFVSPTEVPKSSAPTSDQSSTDGAADAAAEDTQKASDIVSPAEAAQPAPGG